MSLQFTDRAFTLTKPLMRVDEFGHYLKLGIGKNSRFQASEALGKELIEKDFPEKLSVSFVQSVCLWGSDPRRAGMVISKNTPDEIAAALRDTYVKTVEGELVASLKKIMELNGLAVSFGSKHLKFLDPDQHVVLDRIISSTLGYPMDPEGQGYARWLDDCRSILAHVVQSGIEYPGTGKNGWRISDIEMAIFNKIRKSE